ncbi:MAG: Gfo/Idh/MocA family oxidoreductase [Kiritimatiellae bacterium]|nr:Gfo/Idh/MocA family oxidoreductase [Kiritimatiellia bacterium]
MKNSVKPVKDIVRIGIIGTGNMGSGHIRTFESGAIPRAKVTAICDIDPRKMGKFSQEYKRFTDSRELIRSGEVDAVIIATPHYFHTTIGVDALDNGIHTLTEKPISVHKADAEKLIAAHKRNPKPVFAAMFNQRTNPQYQKIRDLIQSGELGKIIRINWIITDWFRTQYYYDTGDWRATWGGEGGGVLMNQCPHQLDLFQWLFGMPQQVRAFCDIGQFHKIEVEDNVTAYMKFANGATGVFITTTGEAPGTNRLEVAGDRGRVVLEGTNADINWTRNVQPLEDFRMKTQEMWARPEVWNVTIPAHGNGDQHAGILRNYVEAILDGKPLIAPAEEGIRAVELCNAMLYSSFTGKTVDLPLDPAAYERHLKKLIRSSTFRKNATHDLAGKEVDMSGSSSVFK